MKNTLIAYIFYFFGCHYLYLGKYWVQLLFWCTGGGFGLWMLVDFFLIHSKVANHNLKNQPVQHTHIHTHVNK